MYVYTEDVQHGGTQKKSPNTLLQQNTPGEQRKQKDINTDKSLVATCTALIEAGGLYIISLVHFYFLQNVIAVSFHPFIFN